MGQEIAILHLTKALMIMMMMMTAMMVVIHFIEFLLEEYLLIASFAASFSISFYFG